MKYIGALDQGTTSTRFIIFDEKNNIVSSSQLEHRQIFPKPGWVEHNSEEIWKNTCSVIETALEKAGLRGDQLSCVGITNQRETIIAFDKHTGKPYHNAIVWQDLRGADFIDGYLKKNVDEDWIRRKTGLLYSPYFSGSKIRWLLDNVPQVKENAEKGNLVFGTIDTYEVFKLTG
ncbi:MAG: FGGY family carbohydrate kinase, partial [Candidatus Ornithospirochaeta sp.]